MADLGTAYVRIRPDVSGFRQAADASIKSELAGVDQEASKAARGVDDLTKAVDDNTTSQTKNRSVMRDILSNWKIMVPAAVSLGAAVLTMTGGFGALAPILPVIGAGLAGIIAPFTTLAAMIVGFIPPVLLLTGLLGGLGAAFIIGFKAAAEGGGVLQPVANALSVLGSMFEKTSRILGALFMPYFLQLIGAAKEALVYIDQLAKMPLDQAFQSLATKGVRMLTDFVNGVAGVLARPIREAFKVAFDDQSTLHKSLVDMWNRITNFFLNQKTGVLLPVESWFGKQDFSATGMRWATELAGATLRALGAAFGKLLDTTGGKLALGGAGAGAGIGLALGGPIGAAIGAAVGAGIGIAINKELPKIRKLLGGGDGGKPFTIPVAFTQSHGVGAPSAQTKPDGGVSAIHAATNDMKALARWAKEAWGWFDGIAGEGGTINKWIQHAWNFTSHFATTVGGALASAWRHVTSLVSTLAGAIQHPISAASRLASLIRGGVASAITYVGNLTRSALGAAWDFVRTKATSVWQSVKTAASGAANWAGNTIRNAVGSALDWIVQKASSVWHTITGFFSNLSVHINWPSPPGWLSKIGLAGGTPNWKGGVTWVGEQGPELAYLPQGTRVIPHQQSMRMAASGALGGGGGNTYNMYIQPPSEVPEAIARHVMNSIARRAGA